MTKPAPKMKTLDDIRLDMSLLYDGMKSGDVDLRTSAEFANVAGKNLKAIQLQLATAMFASHLGKKVDDAAKLVLESK